MISVFISERDELTRLGLKAALESNEDIEIVGHYEDDDVMLSELTSLNPDVVILGGTEDILDRCRTCQKVRTRCPDTKVLTLTEKQKDDDLHEIILSGASGNVLRAAGSSEMVRSIGVVACGGLDFENEALIRLLRRLPRQSHKNQMAELGELTERARTIVSLVAQGYTNEEIGQKLNLSKFTIRNSVGEIRGKLNLKSRTELATFAVQHKLVNLSEEYYEDLAHSKD